MKRVLITLDYNPNSEKVVNKGKELAQLMNAEICLLHVLADVRYYGMQYEPFMGYEGYAFPVDFRIQEEFVKVAQDYLDKTATHIGKENITTHLAEGDTAKRILEYAEEWRVDVIVMGTHSHGTLEKIFLGTVASSVLEHTKIPVYMVPTGK
ncbi:MULTISPECIES: universal stress protein [Aequorivita]|uniref:Universal stress protein n=1 Tax=Aequorivita iocasae TaxID=2803865 RepID=A0ABX7DR42_9FLAO|nr:MULTISPECIES: universal stress protein [Aequorivita]QQX76272.1 universal stress protein [Aequorivita iocasae]UCA55735.1 universal stress protein [Aequorivita sp. F7]